MSDAPAIGPPSGGGGGSERNTTGGGDAAEYHIEYPPRVRRRTSGLPPQFPSQVTGEESMLQTRESLRETRQKRRQDRIGGESKTTIRSQSWLNDIIRDPTVKESDDRWTTLVKLSIQLDNLKKKDLYTGREHVYRNFLSYLREKIGRDDEKENKLGIIVNNVVDNIMLTDAEERFYINLIFNVENWLKHDYAQIRETEKKLRNLNERIFNDVVDQPPQSDSDSQSDDYLENWDGDHHAAKDDGFSDISSIASESEEDDSYLQELLAALETQELSAAMEIEENRKQEFEKILNQAILQEEARRKKVQMIINRAKKQIQKIIIIII